MINEIKIEPQANENLLKIEYKHGGRFRRMYQVRVDLIAYIMRVDQISLPKADADFEKIMYEERESKEFFKKFIQHYH